MKFIVRVKKGSAILYVLSWLCCYSTVVRYTGKKLLTGKPRMKISRPTAAFAFANIRPTFKRVYVQLFLKAIPVIKAFFDILFTSFFLLYSV